MLLADDVVLLSETVIGLQAQLNSLQRTVTFNWREFDADGKNGISHVQNRDRFSVYWTVCTVRDIKTYLLLNVET